MKCAICTYGETEPGTTTVTLERDSLTLVVKGVRAQVCDNCGEAYVDEATTHKLLEAEVKAGAQIEVREYKAA